MTASRDLQSVSASRGIHNKLSFFEEYSDGLESVLELSQLRHVHLDLEAREVTQTKAGPQCFSMIAVRDHAYVRGSWLWRSVRKGSAGP